MATRGRTDAPESGFPQKSCATQCPVQALSPQRANGIRAVSSCKCLYSHEIDVVIPILIL